MGRKGQEGSTAWAELLTAWMALAWDRSLYLQLIFSQFLLLSTLNKTCSGVCVVCLRFKVTLYSAQHNEILKELGDFELLKK